MKRYRRRGPLLRNLLMDSIDFTADEPWTWEDRDFGEFVFHVATGTGPMKYRHLLDREEVEAAQLPDQRLSFDEGSVMRHAVSVGLGFVQRVALDSINEVTVKFEVAGVWSDGSLLVLRSPESVATVPVKPTELADAGWSAVLGALRTLPGWGASAETAVQDATEYASRDEVGPRTRHEFRTRRERPVWKAAVG